MSSLNTLCKKKRRVRCVHKHNNHYLHKSPQRKAMLLDEVLIEALPRKPNSAKRKIVRVVIQKTMVHVSSRKEKKLKRGRKIIDVNKNLTKSLVQRKRLRKGYRHEFFVRVPGNGVQMAAAFGWPLNQGFKPKAKVLIRGGRAKDVPGVRYLIIHREKWRKKRTTNYFWHALPWALFNQRRSCYGIRRHKFSFFTNEKYRDRVSYALFLDKARKNAGCLKKETKFPFSEERTFHITYCFLNEKEKKLPLSWRINYIIKLNPQVFQPDDKKNVTELKANTLQKIFRQQMKHERDKWKLKHHYY